VFADVTLAVARRLAIGVNHLGLRQALRHEARPQAEALDEVLLRVDAGELLVKVIKVPEELSAILVKQLGELSLTLGKLGRQLADCRPGGDGRFASKDEMFP